MNDIAGKFDTISQRVASTYVRMLAPFIPIQADGVSQESQNNLHAFFQALYQAMYDAPDQFGLPVTEDVFYLVDHSKEGPNKTDIKRLLDKPRKLIEEGLGFLRSAGMAGRLDGDNLVLDPGDPSLEFLKKKPGKAWLNGLTGAGLSLTSTSGAVTLSCEKYAKMMPALKALAEATTDCSNQNLGKVFFARCDFKALQQNFTIDPPDLYRIFKAEDFARVAELHVYFTTRNYRPQVEINDMHQWVVKYQGDKSIKSTPLFQIQFDERYIWQIKSGIKCASSGRVVPLLPKQSQALQDDFARRSVRCLDCGWCRNKKTLGPVEYTYQGEQRKICWYVNSDIDEMNDGTVTLVQEYAQMHEALK